MYDTQPIVTDDRRVCLSRGCTVRGSFVAASAKSFWPLLIRMHEMLPIARGDLVACQSGSDCLSFTETAELIEVLKTVARQRNIVLDGS